MDLKHYYYPDPTKIVLIVHTDNPKAGIFFGTRHRYTVFTGACYMDIFMEYYASKQEWLLGRKEVWEENISIISETAVKYFWESYVAITHVIQP